MEVVVNGIRFDIGDNKPLADALKIQQDRIENLKAAKLKVGDKQFAIGDELPAVQALVDTLQTENAQMKQKVGDLEQNQMTPEKLDQVVAERASVIADAVALVPGIKTEGCSCEQIKRDVIAAKAGDTLVTAVLGGVAVGDAKPDQVDTVFRALSAVKSTTPGNAVGDALHQQQQQQNNNQDPKENKGYDKSAAYKTI